MRLVRWLGIVIAALAAALALLVVVARFADGPLGPIAGGPFRSGERVSDPRPDLSFLRDVEEIELQLLEPPRSRRTWVLVVDGEVYVPCGFLDVPLWKQWPHQALEDGRAEIRVDDRRYPVLATKVTDPERWRRVAERAAEKYGFGGAEPDPDAVWFFRMTPRAGGAPARPSAG